MLREKERAIQIGRKGSSMRNKETERESEEEERESCRNNLSRNLLSETLAAAPSLKETKNFEQQQLVETSNGKFCHLRSVIEKKTWNMSQKIETEQN